MIYYSYKEISPLKIEISKILFEESEKLAKFEKKEFVKIQKGEILKLNEKAKKKTRKGKNYPPKKERKRKINNDYSVGRKGTEHNVLVLASKTNRKDKAKSETKKGKKRSKLRKELEPNNFASEDIDSNDFESETHNKNIIINAKKKAKEELYKTQKMDNFELNDLDYEKACEFDDRGFCKTYWSILMREHIVLFTFFTWTDYNLFYVKIERFLILICSQMTVNGLFFVHESMHRKYTNGEDFTFVQKIPQILFTLIASHIIEVLLCYLSMTDTQIYKIKALPKDQNNGEKIIDIIDCMRNKLTGFFIFTFLLFLFYWYFISAFCAVYQNTQVIFLRDCGISILTSFLDPFIIYGITALLRIISLSLCFKKRLGCLYKLSDLIPIF